MDRGRPAESLPLTMLLNEALALEPKYQPHLDLPAVSNDATEITAGIRDGSAHVLRCLKVWYDLPPDVLFVAINLMDRFLTKMKARPKHMACISVAAFQLAARHVAVTQLIEVPEPRDLAAISQCKCTLGDLNRMGGLISSKLDAEPNSLPVTSLTFLRILHSMFAAAAEECGVGTDYDAAMSGPAVWVQLEIMVCDVACANFRPSEIALVLLCAQLHVASGRYPQLSRLVGLALELRKACRISDEHFCSCHDTVVAVLGRYNAHKQMPYRQRLVWRLSQRTMRLLRPTDKLVTTLPTIDEHGQLQTPRRVRSGSLSSEESEESEESEGSCEDWTGMSMESVAEVDEDVPPSTFHCDLA